MMFMKSIAIGYSLLPSMVSGTKYAGISLMIFVSFTRTISKSVRFFGLIRTKPFTECHKICLDSNIEYRIALVSTASQLSDNVSVSSVKNRISVFQTILVLPV